MLNKRIEDALNEQINAEFWSAYFYLSMSSYLAHTGYPGFAKWFNVQFQEEQAHAQIYVNYVLSRGGRVILKPIAEVRTEWDSVLNCFEETLAHENKVTSLINNLYSIALEEKDFATQSMLKWFIDEQVEEEKNAQEVIDNLKMIKDNGYGLYMIDKELGTRTFVTPAPLANA